MSQAGPLDAESSDPQIPTQFNTDDGSAIPIANELNIDAETVANASFTKPHYTTGSGNTVTVNMQLGTAIAGAPADFNDAGIVSFDSSAFTVNENGFVQLIGGGIAIDEVLTANATPQFVQVGSTATVDFDLSNLVLGTDLPNVTTGVQNVGMGQTVFGDLTSGNSNTAIGFRAGTNLTTGSTNTLIGTGAGTGLTTGTNNTFLGNSTGTTVSSGSGNIGIGNDALTTLTTGSNNICLAVSNATGSLTGSESNNIVIGASGVGVTSNGIHIGKPGSGSSEQNKCFIAGITGVTVASSEPMGIDTNGQLSTLGFGTTGQVLTSTGASSSPTWQVAPGDALTITGSTGGALSPSSGNWTIITDNTTVDFAGSGSTLTQDFGLNNLLIGASGSSITSAVSNSAVGDNSLTAITSASYNVGMGDGSLTTLQTGNQNTGIGFIALTSANGSSFNTAIGSNAMQLGATGNANSCLGMQSLQLATGPSYNTCVGYQTGLSYTTTESNNILIGSGVTGTVAETNITRIGAAQNACYIDGIDGVDVGNVATVVTESGDQLGTAVITAGTGVTVTPSANAITIDVSPSGMFTWNDTSGAFSPLKDNGYFITATATGTLPASPSQGDTIKFFVDHATQDLTIQAAGTQLIRFANSVSSATGTAVSTDQGDSVELVYRAANDTWQAVCGFSGTWILS